MGHHITSKDPKYAKYDIGRFTYGAPTVEDYWKHPGVTLKIGAFCSIAKGVSIYLGGNHHTEWVAMSELNNLMGYDLSQPAKREMSQISTKGTVTIGNDVWLGVNSTILSGVTIGDGAVIGLNAIVAKDVPPYAVVVGNPAKVVKKRFEEDIIEDLLKIKWWDWDDAKIKENIPLLLSSNIQVFVDKYNI